MPRGKQYKNIAVEPEVWKDLKRMALDSETSMGNFVRGIVGEKKQKKDGPFFKI